MAHTEDTTQDLLQAHLQLLHESLGYIKSTTLAVALDVGIADAIHHYGGSATVSQILAKIDVSPSKHRGLRRLMRMLTVSGIFIIQHPAPSSSDEHEAVYQLTSASRLLVRNNGSSTSLTPLLSPDHAAWPTARVAARHGGELVGPAGGAAGPIGVRHRARWNRLGRG
ncbi:hypothetical protein HU200_063792 [Digitaria exilis]|uniref:O-methyltransferase dimerisation domain-containing protein n=1 Tax=Digitaria exilis TaxID=1010633 RepID=A0A835DZD6_9POAL|nr:hypothetical protein HU200_063792 [Digitaria exilis]